MSDVYLIDGVRTPQGRYGGSLAEVRPDDLAALVLSELLRRTQLDAAVVDEVIFGAANQAGEDNRNVARMAVLLAGIPSTVPAFTVNRLCASGLTAVASAAQMIRSGEAEIVVAGGVESMTRAPWVLAKPSREWARPGELADSSLGWRFINPRFERDDRGVENTPTSADHKTTLPMGETAEEVATLDQISRSDSDSFALRSHLRAVAAQRAGRFESEIVAVQTPSGEVAVDEGPRPAASLATLAALRPVFRADGIVTAGSSSPLSDGAAAVLLASGKAIASYGLTPRAKLSGSAAAGIPPHIMGLGPVPATEKLLARLDWVTADLSAIEINEAFAAQSVAVMRRLHLDEERVNADGGAIALGHPLGCSGARLIVTLLGRMERENASRALATLCVGVRQGVSVALEAV